MVCGVEGRHRGDVNSVIAASVVLSAVIGILLGLLGGGGSTLTVPMLTFVTGLGARSAITTSLVVVGVTSAVGAVAHARAGRIQWGPALSLGVTGMAGAYLGGRLTADIPVRFTMITFAGIMIGSALALLCGHAGHIATAEAFNLPLATSALLGFTVGVVSGLTGAGGGFLLVAALTLVCRMEISMAVGTSLVVIAMHCFAALAGRLDGAHIDWRLAVMVTAAAVGGSVVGERLTSVIEPNGLRTTFGLLALVMGIAMVAHEVNASQGAQLVQVLAALGLYGWWQQALPGSISGVDRRALSWACHPGINYRKGDAPWNGPAPYTRTVRL